MRNECVMQQSIGQARHDTVWKKKVVKSLSLFRTGPLQHSHNEEHGFTSIKFSVDENMVFIQSFLIWYHGPKACLHPCNPSHHNPISALPSLPNSVSCPCVTEPMQRRVGCARKVVC